MDVTVPVLQNSKALKAGTELVMAYQPKTVVKRDVPVLDKSVVPKSKKLKSTDALT